MYLNKCEDSNGSTEVHSSIELGQPREGITALISHLKSRIISARMTAFAGRYLWTGREWDSEISLQYNRARFYDPASGRWISQDPLGFEAGDSNLYRYANNRLTRAIDPSGLDEKPPFMVPPLDLPKAGDSGLWIRPPDVEGIFFKGTFWEAKYKAGIAGQFTIPSPDSPDFMKTWYAISLNFGKWQVSASGLVTNGTNPQYGKVVLVGPNSSAQVNVSGTGTSVNTIWNTKVGKVSVSTSFPNNNFQKPPVSNVGLQGNMPLLSGPGSYFLGVSQSQNTITPSLGISIPINQRPLLGKQFMIDVGMGNLVPGQPGAPPNSTIPLGKLGPFNFVIRVKW